jgi:hypothetical protein
MTNIELINFVFEKLIAQGARSIRSADDRCMYRGDNGLKCAAGHLIKDEFYSRQIETLGACAGIVKKALTDSGIDKRQLQLVGELQAVHDNYSPDGWPLHRDRMLTQYKGT